MASTSKKRVRVERDDIEVLLESSCEDIDVDDDSLDSDYSPSSSEEVSSHSSGFSQHIGLRHNDHEVSPSEDSDLEGEGDSWVDIEEDPERFVFEGRKGLKVELDENLLPLDIFSLMCDDNLLLEIINVSNRRARLQISQKALPAKMGKWKDITLDELKIFLGLCVTISQVKMPSLKHYWIEKNEMYKHPIFKRAMPRDRFLIILKFLHFYDETNADQTCRLHKVAFLQKILKNIQNLYDPGQELSLDEAMLLWRGRLIFRQYLPGKRHKYGIKFYELCTSDGFIINMQIYTGKGTVNLTPETSHCEEVVLKLMAEYLDKGHSLYMDNFYNSVTLCKRLTDRKTNVCGTLRRNRKGNPKEVVSCKLAKGGVIWRRCRNTLVLKWRDRKDVMMISTMHKHEMVEVENRRGEKKLKPNSVVEYNKFMSGVDRSDQMISYYSSPRKSLRWYMKVFFHFLDVCLWNGCYIWNTTHEKKMKYLEFRDAVAIGLLKDMVHTPRVRGQGRVQQVGHYPEMLEKRKRCKVCYQQQKRTDTWYMCGICEEKPPLCAAPCFKIWHQT